MKGFRFCLVYVTCTARFLEPIRVVLILFSAQILMGKDEAFIQYFVNDPDIDSTSKLWGYFVTTLLFQHPTIRVHDLRRTLNDAVTKMQLHGVLGDRLDTLDELLQLILDFDIHKA